ncbi:MAG: SMP-30/gluconolactonase/LRE family protein [Chloroflexota bacterium]|nr:SMP-30/gluconolactonase/LRE family protein [Chloroflexota bacterium]
MKTLTPDWHLDVQCQLGEGPLWHPVKQRLYWVDIFNHNLFASSQDLKTWTKSHFETPVGAYGFRRDGGFILATGRGFENWSGQGSKTTPIWNPLPGREGVRMNDGKVGPGGRFWAGSMDSADHEAAFYRLDPDGKRHTLLQHIGISNGLGWSPDRRTFYYTDSMDYTIFAFDFDLETGQISNQRPFVKLPKDECEVVPDGLCVDAEGCVWSAQWNGWQIVRYSPEGELLLRVSLPAQRVTSCCFGGPDLTRLFITTAWVDLTDEERKPQPLAGNVFSCPTDTQGQSVNFFG